MNHTKKLLHTFAFGTQHEIYMNGRLLGYMCEGGFPPAFTVTSDRINYNTKHAYTEDEAISFLVNEANKA